MVSFNLVPYANATVSMLALQRDRLVKGIKENGASAALPYKPSKARRSQPIDEEPRHAYQASMDGRVADSSSTISLDQ